jgi:hypothetical protein
MFRSVLGFAIFAVVALVAIKLLFVVFGLVVGLAVTLLVWAAFGVLIYLGLKLISPSTANRVRELITGRSGA